MKKINPYLAFRADTEQPTAPFQPLGELNLLIMVGLTGVGKTTVINQLQAHLNFILLPNRRQITDEAMIIPLQKKDGDTPHPITDRINRFEYTARYRATYPGGMAHALSQLAINADQLAVNTLLFDGLRGLNEVQHACTYFPYARFVVLDAPDSVRLNRLLHRADSFDTATVNPSPNNQNLHTALAAIPHIEPVFSAAEREQIVQTLGDLPLEDVVKKTTIIVAERHNYNSQAAYSYLTNTLPTHQVIVVDTAAHSPEGVTEQITSWF